MKEKLILEILDSKEKRREIQTSLINKYRGTLISFTLNIPGIEKDNMRYRLVHSQAFDYILEKLKGESIKILFENRLERPTGPEGYILVKEDAKAIKRLMIQIEEEHFLGRLFDIDVFSQDNTQVSRKDLNLDMRKCLLCDRDARVCIRENTHTGEELVQQVQSLIEEYLNI